MTTVRSRENTFKVDLSVFPKRPTFEEIHSFVHDTMGLQIDQVKRLQMNHVQNAAHVKCDSLKTAQDAVDQHNERHEIEIDKVKYKVRLQMDDASVEVKVHDLSENVSDEDIATFLRQYGEVQSVKELVWGDKFAFKGVSSGIRVAKMTLNKHIKSFVTIHQEQTLVTYRGQPQTCRHCARSSHPGMTCTDNKKLEEQKKDLDERLKSAQCSSSRKAIVIDKDAEVPNPKVIHLNKSDTVSNPSNTAPSSQQPSVSNSRSGIEEFTTTSVRNTITSTPEEDDPMTTEEDPNMSMERFPEQIPKDNLADNIDTESVFKVPSVPSLSNAVHSDISETDESSTEGSGFQKVKTKRGPRGRPKKQKTSSN